MNKILITGASSMIGTKVISSIDKKNQLIVAHYFSSKNFLTFRTHPGPIIDLIPKNTPHGI